MSRQRNLVIRALFTHSRSTPTCRCMLTRCSATRSNQQTSLNQASYILRRCHITLRSAVGYWQHHRLWYHRFNTHTRHVTLEKQTAMLALVRNVTEFPVLALVNMHRSTELASYNLVHQLVLNTILSLKGTCTNISLHKMLRKMHMLHIWSRCQTFFA